MFHDTFEVITLYKRGHPRSIRLHNTGLDTRTMNFAKVNNIDCQNVCLLAVFVVPGTPSFGHTI